MKQSVQLQQLGSQPCTTSFGKFAVRWYKTDILQGLAFDCTQSQHVCLLAVEEYKAQPAAEAELLQEEIRGCNDWQGPRDVWQQLTAQ